jgi:hypothetical protein
MFAKGIVIGKEVVGIVVSDKRTVVCTNDRYSHEIGYAWFGFGRSSPHFG